MKELSFGDKVEQKLLAKKFLRIPLYWWIVGGLIALGLAFLPAALS
jgi:hypothetical protein